MAKVEKNYKNIAENRKATFNYYIAETFESGLILEGSEVKSLRANRCSITEAFIGEMSSQFAVSTVKTQHEKLKENELYLFNANVPKYEQARSFNHEPKRPRKILLHKKEVNKLLGSIRKKGMTIIPLAMYFNNRGLAKLRIALAQGKNVVDKRETIKERDWNRSKSRILKNYNQ